MCIYVSIHSGVLERVHMHAYVHFVPLSGGIGYSFQLFSALFFEIRSLIESGAH